MKVCAITNTAKDMTAQAAPFQPNYTVVAVNSSAESRILEHSDSSGSGYTTLATLGAAGTGTDVQEVTLSKQYLRTSSGDFLTLLGN